MEGDDVFLSPIKAGSSESDLTEARRKISANSRPSSPLSARIPHPQPDIIDEDAPPEPQPEIKSNDTLIDLARKIAEGNFYQLLKIL